MAEDLHQSWEDAKKPCANNCGRRRGLNCSRGLCKFCHRDLSIRIRYPRYKNSKEKPEVTDRKIVDDGGYPCLWCGARVNEQYMRKCEDCEKELQKRLTSARKKYPNFDQTHGMHD